MTKEIKSVEAEMIVIGCLLEKRDLDLLLVLKQDLFTDEYGQKIIKWVSEKGISPLAILKQQLADIGDTEITDYIDVCIRKFKESGTTDMTLFLDMLDDKRIRRDLYSLSRQIDKDIESGKDTHGLIKKIDKTVASSYCRGAYAKAADTDKKMIAALTENSILGYATGYTDFDSISGGIVPGNLISVGGVSANLKSTSTLSLVLSMLTANEDLTCAFFQIEMPMKDMSLILLGQCNIDRTEVIKGTITPMQCAKALKANKVINRLKVYSVDYDGISSFSDIQRIVLRTRPDIWVVDYAGQLVITERSILGRAASEHNMQFAETMLSLKLLAQRTNTIGIILHQADGKVNKLRRDVRPKMEDIEWSQDIFRLSGYVYMCFYPIKYFHMDNELFNRLFIQIWTKARYANSTFTILEVDPPTGRIYNPTAEVEKLGWSLWDKLNTMAGTGTSLRIR